METQELIAEIRETVKKFNELIDKASKNNLMVDCGFSGMNGQGNLSVKVYQELT